MSLRKELGELLGGELPLLDSLIGPTLLKEVERILDRYDPPACESCREPIPEREIREWRGPWEGAPWWSCPRLCESCFEREDPGPWG